MNKNQLIKLLENTNDRYEILTNLDILSQYDIKDYELVDLIRNFLTDEQIIALLENSKVISKIRKEDLNFIIYNLSDNYKIQLLQKTNFFKEHNFKTFDIFLIFTTFSDDKKIKELLYNKNLIIHELNLESCIEKIIALINNDDIKVEMMKFYKKLDIFTITTILSTFTDKNIIDSLLENKYNLNIKEKSTITILLGNLNTDTLIQFINNNKDYLIKNNINIYEIIKDCNEENQLNIISKFNDINFDESEKLKILATLAQNVKEQIDKSKLPKEYQIAIEHKICDKIGTSSSYEKIIVDLKEDLKKYSKLDEILYINPTEISDEDKSKFLELCEICPKMQLYDYLHYSTSTVEEYKNAEMWIEGIIKEIDENWSDIQKLAFIDNAIGKKISYSPDFETEIFDKHDSRALWKIIDSGYGICNGIAQIEKYILSKVGIESDIICSDNHAFLLVKDIEVPTKNGIIKGNTLVDPTWNLAEHKYGAMPKSFCKSYSEIRKSDIMKDGTDSESHKITALNEEDLINLEEENLKNIFATIGLTDKNGIFPIKEFVEQCIAIDKLKLSGEDLLKKQLSIFANYYPDFATCNNSTSFMLQGLILNLTFNKCIINRVYDRKDKNKIPILYVYVDFPKAGKKFYFADRKTQQFIELSQKEFEEKFECYQMDMKNYNGYRPWEYIEKTEKLKNLDTNSEDLVASKGDEK